jgi:hypothetical protein
MAQKISAPVMDRMHPETLMRSLLILMTCSAWLLSLSGCRDKDNNAAKRMIRGPVVTRKNARGSHNGDTTRNAAVIWTVTGTAQMAGLNILTYLTAYLDECGRNRGKPLTGPELERFLPWNASPEDLRTWAQPPPAR